MTLITKVRFWFLSSEKLNEILSSMALLKLSGAIRQCLTRLIYVDKNPEQDEGSMESSLKNRRKGEG